jgi:LacI family transcriptional regulator
MTVSVVLNGARSATRVSDATRARIVSAAARLRYQPNAVARGLSRRRMDAIGVVATVDGEELNLYFLEILNGILEEATARGQNTTIFSVTHWNDEQAKMAQCCDGRVDGLIFISPHMSPEMAQELQHRHTPFLTTHNTNILPGVRNLGVDNEHGAHAAVRHLIDHGHRRILHFPGIDRAVDTQERLAGYHRALAEADLPFDPSLVVPGHYSASSGAERTRRMLAEGWFDPLPTAIFCGNDAIASGCMEVLAANGIRCPDDISIVGFDDTMSARMTTPALTTVRQPFRRLGRRAVSSLLELIGSEILDDGDAAETFAARDAQTPTDRGADAADAPEAPWRHHEVFGVELVIRASVGAPPALPLSPPRA